MAVECGNIPSKASQGDTAALQHHLVAMTLGLEWRTAVLVQDVDETVHSPLVK